VPTLPPNHGGEMTEVDVIGRINGLKVTLNAARATGDIYHHDLAFIYD
jgi:hypothetical protein